MQNQQGNQTTALSSSIRLEGLDLARFIAFVGMVLVNFKIAMGADNEAGPLSQMTLWLEGRAAAAFVVLAGIGLGLSASYKGNEQTILITLKRAGFLLGLGLLNSLIFDADILHYYAFYFIFGVMLLRLKSSWLVAIIMFLNLTFLMMIIAFDFDHGWNWNNYSYVDFWTPAGFVRNLFFNGWHPVIPWLGFLLFGIILSRSSLSQTSTQNRIILFGLTAFIFAEILSALLSSQLFAINPELLPLTTTEPVPPLPLYMLASSGAACVVIGLCLRLSGWLGQIGILGIFTPAGRQTLTLYIAHILIGMGMLDAVGMLGGQTLSAAVTATLVFSLIAVIYAFVWSRAFKRGLIEEGIRKFAG